MKVLIMLSIMLSTAAFGSNPTADQISKVMEYKENGKTPILYDFKITSDVVKNEPQDSLSNIDLDSKASFWMKFFVPNESETTSVIVVIKKGPIAVKTKELSLKNDKKLGSYRYRTWTNNTFKKSGEHSVEVYVNEELVKSAKFNVQ